MTNGQAFLALAFSAASAVGVMIAASARWRREGLVISAAALALASGLFFRSRAVAGDTVRDLRWLITAAVLSLIPVAVAAAVVYLRRAAVSRLLTGALAWAGLMFAFFESAYLLRP